jgi:hypothetical protein
MTPIERRRARLLELYGFAFPEELELIYSFCRFLKPLDPLHALESPMGFILVGPFEVLDGRFDAIDPPASILLHHRRPWELPEFFPVLAAADGVQHWGYFLDNPGQPGLSCTALTDRSAGPGASLESDTLAGGLRLWVEQVAADLDEEGPGPDVSANEAREMAKMLEQCRLLAKKVCAAVGVESSVQKGNAFIKTYDDGLKARDAMVVLPTQDGTGIVAPQELCRTSIPIQRIHEAVWRKGGVAWLERLAHKALATGRPGLALFIGHELWAPGTRRRRAIASPILEQAYTALNRPVLARVVAAERAHADRLWRDVGQA